MTNKERLNELKSEMDLIIIEREQLLSSNTKEDNTISLDIETLIKLKGFELKTNSIREQIGELSQIIHQEERELNGYNVFGVMEGEDGKFNKVSKVIPYHLKEKYLEEFDVVNSTELPHITKIETFLNDNL